jgi:hypothetical protein
VAEPDDVMKKPDRIRVYLKAYSEGQLYLLKNEDGDLDAPSKRHHYWKNILGHRGGIAMIEILPTDPNYCVNCTYTGYFKTRVDNKITVLVDVEHDGFPI